MQKIGFQGHQPALLSKDFIEDRKKHENERDPESPMAVSGHGLRNVSS
jgi:hypothetical protein